GVRAARALPSQPASGADPLDHLRTSVGLRLRLCVELPRRLHRLPAAEDRSRRRTACDPHRARRRVRTPGAMSFRARLAMVAAAAVALAIVAASFVVYFVVKQQLRGPIDSSLRHSAVELQQTPPDDIPRGLFHLTAPLGGAAGYPQVVKPNGQAVTIGPGPMLPVDDRDIAVARGEAAPFLRDAHVSNTHVRMITFPIGGFAVQVVRNLTEVDHSLAQIETWLILIA